MARALKLGIRLTADGKGFVGEIRVAKKELDKLTRSTSKGTATTRAYSRASKQSEVATRKAGRSFFEAHGNAVKYFGVIGGIAGVTRATQAAVRYADSYTQISNAIRIATDSTAEYNQVQDELFAIAQRTRAPLQSVADLYQKISISQTDLGASNEDILSVIEGVGQALVINGTSAQAASGALLQFSQALGGDIVRAEEFNSILEGAKPILIAVANNLDRASGSVGKLRKLVAEGSVTSKEFFAALKAGLPDLAAGFEQTNATIANSLVQVDNAITRLIGRMDEAEGVSALIGGALETLAEGISEIDADELSADLAALVKVGGVVATLFVGRAAIALTAYAAKSSIASVRLRGLAVASTAAAAKTDVARLRMLAGANAARRYGGAVRGASFAVRGFSRSLTLLGGPLGIALLAAYGIYEFATANNRASDSLSGLPEEVDAFRESLKKLNKIQLQGRRVGVADDLVKDQAALREAEKQLSIDRQKITRGRAPRSEAFKESARLVVIQSAALVEDAKKQVALQQQRLDLINAAISVGTRPDALDIKTPTATTPTEPLDPKFDKILQSLHSRERVIRDRYAAQIAAVRDGGAALGQALAEEGKTREQVIDELQARQTGELAKIQQQQESVAADARQRAWKATGLPDIIERVNSEQAVTIAGVQTRTAAELALVKQHGAKLAALGINSADLIKRIEADKAAQITQITREATEDRQRQEREAYDASARLQSDQQAIKLASLLGFHDQIIQAEYDKQGRLAELQAEQLAQAAGFDSVIAERALAFKQRLIDIESSHAPKVASIQKKLLDFEVKTGTQKVQSGLAVAQETFGNFAAHSKKAFRLQQIAGIANATISIAQGIAKALELGPILGPIGAAVVAAAGFAQIAAIRAQQPPQAFARGGVVDSPTFFSARNVPSGVAGEAGPEGILPLKRLPGGQLGVGYAGGGKQQNITFAPVVQVEVISEGGDARTTGAEIGRGVREQLEPMFRGLLVNELRPGGLLNSGARV